MGILTMLYHAENILKQLPDDVSIKFMRPVGFYYNMFAFIETIKTQGAIVSNYGGDDKEPWVSPLDIAAVIAEEIEKPFEGREIRYIASDEVSPSKRPPAKQVALNLIMDITTVQYRFFRLVSGSHGRPQIDAAVKVCIYFEAAVSASENRPLRSPM